MNWPYPIAPAYEPFKLIGLLPSSRASNKNCVSSLRKNLAKFFLSELTQFLLLAREEGKSPMSLKGSYAGAMGYGQFISSSYRNYAVDFDEDGVRDIWSNKVDAIGSVANYFARHGHDGQNS